MISKNNMKNTIDDRSNQMNNRECLTIGRIAPDFSAITTQGPITLSQFRGKWVVFFSHPGDFTLVLKGIYIN